MENGAGAGAPLEGKTVAVVHAAWHSCGSYQVNVSEIMAYRALGARVVSVALMDALSPPAPQGGRWAAYIASSQELEAVDARYFIAAPPSRLWTSGLLVDGWWPLVHGDQASWLIGLAKRAEIPDELLGRRFDLVHANHYFTLPVAHRLARGAPVMVETQDIQTRQYVLRNQSGFFIPPYANFEDMLRVEIDWTSSADLCIHLNAEEYAEFERLLPQSRHALIYPATPPAPLSEGAEIVIVASDNYANYMSLRWFLIEVVPRAGDVKLAIYGNIDAGVRLRDAALYERHRTLFAGRVADIGAVYRRAGCILLPTIEGHGISMKTVEALSCGAPLIASPLAFRGMNVDPRALSNVVLCDDAAAFAAALRAAAGQPRQASDSADSDTRRLFEETFSPRAYARALAAAVRPLL